MRALTKPVAVKVQVILHTAPLPIFAERNGRLWIVGWNVVEKLSASVNNAESQKAK